MSHSQVTSYNIVSYHGFQHFPSHFTDILSNTKRPSQQFQSSSKLSSYLFLHTKSKSTHLWPISNTNSSHDNTNMSLPKTRTRPLTTNTSLPKQFYHSQLPPLPSPSPSNTHTPRRPAPSPRRWRPQSSWRCTGTPRHLSAACCESGRSAPW